MPLTCFVTVGSTRFDELTNEVLTGRVLSALRKIGVSKLIVQIGAGELVSEKRKEIFGEGSGEFGEVSYKNFDVEIYRYRPTISKDISRADVVIGHAGAGTILEALGARKPLIVVINERLMDNHQAELAEKLAASDHLLFCNISSLEATILNPALFSLRQFDPPSLEPAARFIDRRAGVKF